MVSVIICTHNRAKDLQYCLESFVRQDCGLQNFEVLVIDNASSDNTAKVVSEYSERYPSFKYHFEPNVGLSYARNTGNQYATYDLVAYCDDDAEAADDFVSQVLNTFQSYSFDAIGGRFLPLYRNKKKKWLPADFGSNLEARPDIGDMPDGHSICGGVMAFKKERLTLVGGFPVNLGMRGNKIGYGEDNWIQDKFIENGFRVGFNPHWKIHHLVALYKQKLSWHIKSRYAHAKASYSLWTDERKATVSLMWLLKHSVKELGKSMRVMTKKKEHKYYIQNIVLDIISPQASLLGYYHARKQSA